MMQLEEGMSEEDELWKPDDRETDEHMQMRMRRAMDRVFDGNYSTCELAPSPSQLALTRQGSL